MARRVLFAALLVLVVLGVWLRGDPFRTPASGVALYEVTATVIQEGGDAPEICLGLIALSDPPQCGGPRLEGWDWGDVDGEETGIHVQEGDTRVTFGEFHVTGSYDDGVFTVVDAGSPEPANPDPDLDALGTPCPEPPGGWAPADRKKASEWDADRAGNVAEEESDFGGIWVDHYDPDGPDEGRGIWADGWADDRVILNIAFTGSLERHERELRKLWGGPLCLTKADRTYLELQTMQDEIAEYLGREVLGTSVNAREGTVEVHVITLDAATKAAIHERYGAGVVRFEERLQPAG